MFFLCAVDEKGVPLTELGGSPEEACQVERLIDGEQFQSMLGRVAESELEDRELRRVVLDEVKSLGEPDREILLRKFYLGEPSKEIAVRLGLTTANVDTRTHRAVEKLRKKLKEWGSFV